MKALITGVTGFVGPHLVRFLNEFRSEIEVVGLCRWSSRRNPLFGLDLKLVEGDITDSVSMTNIIKQIRPDIIFHLAAQSYVPASWEAPIDTFTTNAIGQLNLLEACREAKIDPVIQIAGSSEEYGKVSINDCPITEDLSLHPISPYSVSKVAQDYFGYQYFMSYGMRIIRTRAFNHTGPGRNERFVTSNFAKQIAEMEKNLREPVLKTGNLDSIRDFSDVRDIVKAYVLAVEKCEPGEVYNICSGQGYRIAKIIDTLRTLAKVEFTHEYESTRMRPSDVPLLQGDCSKFKALTGWEPTIKFEKTIEDLLNWWREKI